ncbi:phosphate ABC transporter substrate-binding protein [Desulforhopalus vacuolatus]|uniref:phosphate ABC transporter substrate-binding protein n=1 Tax=Desulforhopalus vacuolatus TaxID=40414 RepID=UPI00196403D9|nr:phosphate ABC transporter substrate-binding protein [Desulforhopalus vacuolatus]MBM9519970.1 phosphate ABC transporter substrate-binding protein [Desulforhopalus vacuolatus]
MKRIVFCFAFIAALGCCNAVFAGSALDAFKGQEGVIKVAGGTAHIPVMKEAAKCIARFNPKVIVTVAGGGSGVGIRQVGEGLVDIGDAGRSATEEEISRYNLVQVKWAVDGVGVVVSPKNSVKSLSTEQLQQVFAGTISNWKELGGEDHAIDLYDRDSASGTRAVFVKKALKKGAVNGGANVVVSNGAMKTAIGGDPYGIGYVSVGHIDSTVTPVALDGVVPTIPSVQDGSYPVARGLYSSTRGKATGLSALLLNYLLSPEGQKIVEEKGFIGVK